MNRNERDDELSTEEKEALASLPREETPPEHLARKVVAMLKEDGMIENRTTSQSSSRYGTSIRLLAATLAAIALLAAGFFAGKWKAQPATHNQPMFALFLYSPATEPENDEHVQEYAGWIRNVGKSGRLAGGEKLTNTGRVLQMTEGNLSIAGFPTAPQNQMVLGGYFIIQAKNYEEAVQIATSCPHLKYGGIIELRQIDSI